MKLLPLAAAIIATMGSFLANDAYPPEIAAWTETDIAGFKAAGAELKQKLLAAVKSGAKEFTVPPGHYFFEGKSPVILIEKANGLTINAQGATFWFNPAQHAMEIKDSRNVTLKGLTFDYYPLPCSQGRITALNFANKSLDLEIDPGFPIPDPAVWVKRVGAIKAIFFDPEGARMRETKMDWISALEPLEGRKMRVRFKEGAMISEDSTVKVGDRLALPFRDQPVVYANDGSSAVTLEDVTFHAAGNFAMYEEPGDGGNIYRRCQVVRRPNTKRLLACNADILHVNTAGKGPLIEDCELSFSGDDILNIHSVFSVVTEQKNPRAFVMINHYTKPVVPGQKLQIFDFATFGLLGEPTVTKVTVVPGTQADADKVSEIIRAGGERIRNFKPPITYLEVEIDRDLVIPPFAMVGPEDSGGAGTIIRNSHLHDNFTRCILLRGSDLLVENNRIERSGWTGLQIGGDRFWLESPTPRRVVVRNNQFNECAFGKNMRETGLNAYAVISITSLEEEKMTREQVHAKDIAIKGNTINGASQSAIAVIGATGVQIVRNTINRPGQRESKKPDKLPVKPDYAISLANVSDVTLIDNTINDPGPFYKGPLFLGRWVSGEENGKPITSSEN